LETDGIKCFDLNNSDLIKEDLRMSIAASNFGNLDEASMQMFADLEKLKRENEALR